LFQDSLSRYHPSSGLRKRRKVSAEQRRRREMPQHRPVQFLAHHAKIQVE
jgi:hypothetical protein